MAYTAAGLPSNSHTQFFNVKYDDALNHGRGLDLAPGLMQFCDIEKTLLVQNRRIWPSAQLVERRPKRLMWAIRLRPSS